MTMRRMWFFRVLKDLLRHHTIPSGSWWVRVEVIDSSWTLVTATATVRLQFGSSSDY